MIQREIATKDEHMAAMEGELATKDDRMAAMKEELLAISHQK